MYDRFSIPIFFYFQVYVLKRPYVDEFLQKMGELFECVLFTASLAKVSDTLVCISNSKPNQYMVGYNANDHHLETG